MKKNAFTLIELIATIALLGMLATIVITVAVKKINETKEKSREMLIESIELAAITYVTENTEELINFQKNDYIYVTLKTLVEKEYFTASLIDQTTKKSLPITDTVYVTRNQNGTITATYDINQRQKAQMILNGAYNEYLKVGSEYIEKGVLATASDGSDISTSITTSGSVDTTKTGTYTITYTYNNQKITRNVIVYQGEGPSEILVSAVKYITNLYNNEQTREENGLIKDNTIDQNIRYAGSNDDVKNYVEFGNTGELWRIIGIFDVSNGTSTNARMKLVRNESIGNFSWDSSSEDENAGRGINQWGESTLNDRITVYDGADLKKILNSDYYNKSGSFTANGMNKKSKDMISSVVWTTGAVEFTSEDTISALDSYNKEKSELSGKVCSSGTYCTDSVLRTSKWKGNIGLIYPSDYGYATSNEECRVNIRNYSGENCKSNDWLYDESNYWTITSWPFTGNVSAVNVWSIYSNGNAYHDYDAVNVLGVRPSVYLKPSVRIVSGTGTSTDPYKLSI